MQIQSKVKMFTKPFIVNIHPHAQKKLFKKYMKSHNLKNETLLLTAALHKFDFYVK